MKFYNVFAVSALCLASAAPLYAQEVESNDSTTSINIFNETIFFDGYNSLEGISDESKAMIPENDGILRHRTSLYATKLTDQQLAQIGEKFRMEVIVGALCDNYDRIGNINLAFVPKGQETYNPDEVKRIELGRFITPFMNKNKQPDEVPYIYDMDFVSLILRDANLRADYDIWAEFELFGIPYAANEQIFGCKSRQDVFTGTLNFITDKEPAALVDNNVLIPLVIKKPEYIGGNFNNYSEGASDVEGQTVKTWTFTLEEDVTDAQVVFITSNHGANQGGEEYNRRKHNVYFDGKLSYIYTPGRESCEPFRKYNTQPNGIYGWSEMSDDAWQSFSNWCPGDKIDTRVLHVGSLSAGEHTFKIKVIGAKFADKQGDIPVSIYFQGVKNGNLPNAAVKDIKVEMRSAIAINGDKCIVTTEQPVREILLYDVEGQLLEMVFDSKEVSLKKCNPGVNIVVVEYADGLSEYHKIMR